MEIVFQSKYRHRFVLSLRSLITYSFQCLNLFVELVIQQQYCKTWKENMVLDGPYVLTVGSVLSPLLPRNTNALSVSPWCRHLRDSTTTYCSNLGRRVFQDAFKIRKEEKLKTVDFCPRKHSTMFEKISAADERTLKHIKQDFEPGR